jgi:urease accessory protein
MIQKALYPEGDEICHAVVLHPPAGIAGGDHLHIEINILSDSKAVVTTPGATKWYKSNGLDASQVIHLHVEHGAHLDFLPQENIFFNQTSARNAIYLHQDLNSSMIGWDISQLGRVAMGEKWTDAHLKNELQLFLNERLCWLESSEITSEDLRKESDCKLGGYPVLGVMWLSGTAATGEVLERILDFVPWTDQLRVGVTRLELTDKHGLILIRGIATEVEYLKDCFIQIWLNFRQDISEIPPLALRLWKT